VNERLLELAKQAGLKKDHGSDREYLGDFDWREFAELIVQESIGVVDKDDGATHVRELLEEHFGVKNDIT
jgi:hypothetical protein